MKSQASDDALAGAFAGAISRILCSPFDVLKIRYQLQFNDGLKRTSLLNSFRSIIREEGFFSLWKGNLSATYLWISYAMVQFSVYGFLKKYGETVPDPFVSAPANQQFDSNGRNGVRQSRGWHAFMLFLAGSGAGISSTAVTYPFDIMRTQFAVQGQKKAFGSMRSFVTTTMKTKGLKGFYAGLTPALVGITPYMGLNFAIYESIKATTEAWTKKYEVALHPYRNIVGTVTSAMCGGVAGGVSKFIVYPLDTVKKRLQSQVLTVTLSDVGVMPKYTGALHCISKMWADEGITGFYRGIVPTLAKSVVATAVTFAAFEAARDFLVLQRKLSSMAHKDKPLGWE